ncbi:uncharacterized protein C8Q71DRAFT_858605 [Rhodofomes roseus]|uniref:Uncharacterized protein n=1 Tax=Rhodofomes roseus TaxID=34475 RepID=A0ABQ8KDX7_9APHY|nr:uncharacterized protein C8Q71DRAFT_858605 [Rhodofomes roseus]KAH9835756.1 hypothetical protein C8Q71DRAFT_858605 [Rhodofomes roseus]
MWPPLGRHNSDSAWEVVDSKSIEPVSVYDDPDDLPILRVASENVNVSCTYDVRPPHADDKARSPVVAALLNARGRLLREAALAGYNALLVEGWSVTLQRKAAFHTSHTHPHSPPFRLAVHYTGRPALVGGAHPGTRPPPPFLGMLQDWGAHVDRAYFSAVPRDSGERSVSRSTSTSRVSRVLRTASSPPRSPSPREVKRKRVLPGGVATWRRGVSSVLRIMHL